MALSEADLSEIESVLAAAEPGASVVGVLRQKFPRMSLTQCDSTDVTEAPFRSYPGFELHLLDSADHCAHVTDDPSRATGLILARRG